MEHPLISVIVPVYNVEKYLDKCVQSLLAQTYPNYEIILVDDGSPDGCPAMCDTYGKQYDNVTVYHKENGGLGAARNYGVQRAKGGWIVFVDSDDYVLPDYLLDLWQLKEKHHANLAAAGPMPVDDSDMDLGTRHHFDSFVVSGSCAQYEMCVKQHVGNGAWNKLYPRSVLLQVPFPNVYYEDAACMYKIVDLAGTLAIGDFNQNYRYLQRDGSISRTRLSEKHIQSIGICDEFDDFINEKYPELRYLKSVFASGIIWYALSLLSMSYREYRQMFKMRRDMIRRGLKEVITQKDIPLGVKTRVFVLSTLPCICKVCSMAKGIRDGILRARSKWRGGHTPAAKPRLPCAR